MAVVDPLGSAARLARVAVYQTAARALGVSFLAAARRASELTGASVGLVTLVTDDAQWFAGHHNLPAFLLDIGGTPLEWSFCEAVVRSDGPLWLDDLRTSERHARSIWVTRAGLLSYVGVPLRESSGFVVGCVCALSAEPKPRDERALRGLAQVAGLIAREVEAYGQGGVSAPPSGPRKR